MQGRPPARGQGQERLRNTAALTRGLSEGRTGQASWGRQESENQWPWAGLRPRRCATQLCQLEAPDAHSLQVLQTPRNFTNNQTEEARGLST